MPRKVCRRCGGDVGRSEHVELRVLDWEVEEVKRASASHYRRSGRSIASLVFCPECAVEIMGRVYEGVES